MKIFWAHVVKGRFVIEEPSTLPEGTVVGFMIVDEPVGDISVPEHAELRAALVEAEADFRAGRGHDLEDVIRSRKIVKRKKASKRRRR